MLSQRGWRGPCGGIEACWRTHTMGRWIGIAIIALAIGCGGDDEGQDPVPVPIPVQIIPVSFQVQNVNRSVLTCKADRKTYTLRGHIVAPQDFDRTKRQDAVTVYVHAVSTGEFLFSDENSPTYSTAHQMAERGHVSLVYDRLGFDSSDHPPGLATCMGAQADMARQVADLMRSGSYTMEGGQGPAFEHVALLGLSGGGVIANIAAASFDAFDAVTIVSTAIEYKTEVLDAVGQYFVPICMSGGEAVEDDGTGEKGYSYFAPKQNFIQLIYSSHVDPGQKELVLQALNRDPCGDLLSFPDAVMAEATGVANIHKPVLLVTGHDDALFVPDAGKHFAAMYTGTSDFSFVELADCGHEPSREPSASGVYFDTIDDWLAGHGF